MRIDPQLNEFFDGIVERFKDAIVHYNSNFTILRRSTNKFSNRLSEHMEDARSTLFRRKLNNYSNISSIFLKSENSRRFPIKF